MNYVALITLARKEVIRIVRIWPQTIIPSIITICLYFLIFGNLIGTRIGKIGNFDYMKFIVPGLIMMSIITNSYANVVSSFFGNKFQKNIEEILIAPMSNWVIIVGYCAGGLFRGILLGILVTCVSLFFTKLTIHNLSLVIFVVFLTASLFSLAGFLNAIFAKKFDDIGIFTTFILSPLTYLGGVFYSINMLPDHWRTLSLFNPILYMVDAFRYGFLGVSDINIYIAVSILIFCIITLFVVCVYLLKIGYGLRE